MPLALIQNGSVMRLAIDVGIGSGPGTTGKLYLFDTGSAAFNASYSAAWWPAGITPNTTPLAVNQRYAYTDGDGYNGNVVVVPDLTVFSTTGAMTPVTLSAPTPSVPSGSSPGFQVNAVTTHTITVNNTTTTQNFITNPLTSSSAPPVEGVFFGTFGAANFVDKSSQIPLGGVLGQATTSGYIVAANGQPAPSPVNGPQVGQTVTSCSPCVMLGLTPALQAQFLPINTISWTTPGVDKFPVSGANSSTPTGVIFNYTVSAPGQAPASWSGPTLLDSGTPNLNALNTTNAAVINNFEPSNSYQLNPGTTLTIAGGATGGTTSSDVVNTPNPTVTYNATVGPGTTDSVTHTTTANNTVGIAFFLQNSVLFNLGGQAVGYTPNFVTDAAITTTQAAPLTIGANFVPLGLAGIISGPGGVSITSGGSATLSGANTYSGATAIASGGQLFIAGAGTIAASSGVATNGLFDISGACAPLAPTGACGSAAPSISVAVNGLSGVGQVNLGANNLTIANANSGFSGVIADGGIAGGSGGSLTVGGGSLTLSGANTYTGDTNITAGTLTVASPGSLVGNITEAVGSTLINSGTIRGGITNNGGVLINSGTITGGVADPLAAMTINTGIIGGAVTIAAGSALSNSGEIDGDVTDSGIYTGHGHHKGNLDIFGVVSASTAIGLTRVDKGLTFEQGSVYQVSVDGKGNSDVISVAGAIRLKGGTVVLTPTSESAAALGRYTILSSDSSQISGRFDGLATQLGTLSFPFLSASLAYTPNTASIVLARGARFASAAGTEDQAAVGAVLDSSPSTPLFQPLARLNYATAPAALTALSGDIYASTGGVMQQQTIYLRDAVTARLRQALAPSGDNPQIAALGPVSLPLVPGSTVTVWQRALGAWGGNDSGGNATGLSRSVAGYLLGVDAPFDGGWRAGLASGFDQDWFNSTGTAASGAMKGAHLAGYAGHRYGPTAIEFGASNTWYSGSTTRTVAFPGFIDTDRGGISATATQVFGELTWDQPISTVVPGGFLQPFAALAYAHVATGGATETGGAAALIATGSTRDNEYTSIGVRGGVPLRLGDLPFRAEGLIGWQHAFGSVVPQTALAFAGGGGPFSVQGMPFARDAALVGAGLHYDLSPTLAVSLGYSGRIAARARDEQAIGNLAIRF